VTGSVPILCALVLAAPWDSNVLENPNFERGLAHWDLTSQEIETATETTEGRNAARIRVASPEQVGFPRLFQSFGVKPGDVLRGKAEILGRGLERGRGAYLSIDFLDAGNKRLGYVQSARLSGMERWIPIRVEGVAPPEASKAHFCLTLNGLGEALFRDVALFIETLDPPASLEGPVTLEVTSRIARDSLIGFGFEDDGWFYNEENRARGVSKEDAPLREGRIEWMDPDWVRMFFWHKDWCPSGDWETFTFDSENMQSHYRTLDLYQRIGTRVNVVGVEWGMKKPYEDAERAARGIARLLAHLIRDKGYACIRDWTLSNEPNDLFPSRGYSFDRYVALLSETRKEIHRLGLEVQVVGADDADSLPWFRECVSNPACFEACDIFASHRYFPHTDAVFIPSFFESRQTLLGDKTPPKPFVVAEFGFQDKRSGTLENPIMETYPYALWAARFAIEGLNAGVEGFSIWCLHEMVYPSGAFMNYGLWNFKDREWEIRPVYHAWLMFTRGTESGDAARLCLSSHPETVKAAFAGNTLFWVNLGEEAVPIQVLGVEPKTARVHTEATLWGDRESGRETPITDGRFELPPRSFGYAR